MSTLAEVVLACALGSADISCTITKLPSYTGNISAPTWVVCIETWDKKIQLDAPPVTNEDGETLYFSCKRKWS